MKSSRILSLIVLAGLATGQVKANNFDEHNISFDAAQATTSLTQRLADAARYGWNGSTSFVSNHPKSVAAGLGIAAISATGYAAYKKYLAQPATEKKSEEVNTKTPATKAITLAKETTKENTQSWSKTKTAAVATTGAAAIGSAAYGAYKYTPNFLKLDGSWLRAGLGYLGSVKDVAVNYPKTTAAVVGATALVGGAYKWLNKPAQKEGDALTVKAPYKNKVKPTEGSKPAIEGNNSNVNSGLGNGQPVLSVEEINKLDNSYFVKKAYQNSTNKEAFKKNVSQSNFAYYVSALN